MVCALLLRKNFLNFKWWMPVSNCSTLEPREWIYSFIHSALKGCSHSEPGPHLEWKGRGSWCSHTHPYHFQTLAAVRSMLTGISTAWFHTRGSTVTQQNTCTSLSIAVRSMATQITYWMQTRQRKWFMFSVKAKCMFIIHSFVLSRHTLSVDLKHRRSIYSSQITLMHATNMHAWTSLHCQKQFIGSHTRSISPVTTNSRSPMKYTLTKFEDHTWHLKTVLWNYLQMLSWGTHKLWFTISMVCTQLYRQQR